MINKFYKRIHNKYLNLFKFFFFLRYVFAIFTISISLFLSIPKFFNYEKKHEIIKGYLINYYDLELNSFNDINFNIFPLPHLLIQNANTKIKNQPIILDSSNIKIFLNIKNIYNYKNFKAKKIILNKNKVFLEASKSKELINYLFKLKHKLKIINLDMNFKKDDNLLIELKNVNFKNYGYEKYHFDGEVFGKRFKVSLKNDNRNLNFKILKTGVEANFEFNKKISTNFISGSSKINILNNLIRFDFNLINGQLTIARSNFRNKDLSFSLDSLIKFDPFFQVNSNINVNESNKHAINLLSLDKILQNRKIIKKLNSKINIDYKSTKYFKKLIEGYSFNLNLAYGRLAFSNKILISGGNVNCTGETLLLDEFPRLNFNCLLNLEDSEKLLKKLSISQNNKKGQLNASIVGSINLLNKKINFKEIIIKKNIQTKEDLKYYKESFENILFDEDFFQIFNKDKIKEFILEIV